MASEMMAALEQLCEERHIDQLDLITRLEQSLAKSYADVLHLPFGARVTIDRATGRVYVYELVPRGEEDPETGEYAEFDEVDVTPADTSRIAQGRDPRHRAQRRARPDLRGVLAARR